MLFLTGQAEISRTVEKLNKAIEGMPDGTCTPLQVGTASFGCSYFVLDRYCPCMLLFRFINKVLSFHLLQKAVDDALLPQTLLRHPLQVRIPKSDRVLNWSEVDGIVYVIDPGTVKQKIYDSQRRIDSLQVVSISHVQAKQRAGRAGRTREGLCFRLYSKEFYENHMSNVTLPEIQRTALVSTVLYLKSLEMDIDVLNFEFLDKPDVRKNIKMLIKPRLFLERSVRRCIASIVYIGCDR